MPLTLALTSLEARVLFHLLNDHLSVEQLLHTLQYPNEREAARQVYQRIRTLAYPTLLVKEIDV
jgi:hypothetical protein